MDDEDVLSIENLRARADSEQHASDHLADAFWKGWYAGRADALRAVADVMEVSR